MPQKRGQTTVLAGRTQKKRGRSTGLRTREFQGSASSRGFGEPRFGPAKTTPNLSRASSSELISHLRDENGWWRDTAQRLLVERGDRAVISSLKKLAAESSSPAARLHALYTLDGLKAKQAGLPQ